jgi:hypothetical protein
VNMNVGSQGDLLWEGQHKLNLRPHFQIVVGREIQPAKAHVSRFSFNFVAFRARLAQRYRQGHREAPGNPAFCSSFQTFPQVSVSMPLKLAPKPAIRNCKAAPAGAEWYNG